MRRASERHPRLPAEDELGPDLIVCRLCGKTYRTISYSHLHRIHGWEGKHPVEAYKRTYGLPVASCHDTWRLMRRRRIEKWKRSGRHWTRQRILEALRQRARAGKPLAASRLGSALSLAILRYYGTWDRAMGEAGLDPAAHRLRKRWSGGRLVAAILSRRERGASLAMSVVEREDPRLHSAAVRCCGNWSVALRAAGLDPRVHRLPSKWSLERARAWITARRKARLPITAGHVPVGLYSRVCREHPGGWTAFVESLGIPYPGLRKRRDWTDAKVLAAIRDRRRRGLPMNLQAVMADGQALTHQARDRFGSWDAALQKAGIDPWGVRLSRTWSRGDVVRAIRNRHSARRPMGYTNVVADDPRLVKAAQRLFPYSWARALAAAGLNPALARAPRKAQGKR